jgi:REP element-mobilizing transposase RayT
MGRFPRLPPRLDRVFLEAPVYFVTFCTHRRRPLLANPELHAALVAFSKRAYLEHNVAVGRYVILPDHIHLFVSGDRGFDLGRWIGLLKQVLAKCVVRRSDSGPVWQRGFFDHVLRAAESYSQKWEYVRDNPVRAKLVCEADAWPYAGEIVIIDRV